MSKEAISLRNALEEPKSPVDGFTLPCGYVGPDGKLYRDVTLREITGAEEDIMVARNMSTPAKVTAILANCIQRLGPFDDKSKLLSIARALTSGDRIYALIALRRISLGNTYPLEDDCPRCNRSSYYELDLAALDVKTMPNPLERVYTVPVSGERRVTTHVLCGADEERGADYRGDGDLATLALALRVDAINDEPCTFEQIKALSLRDRNTIREAFEEREGGVDTSLDIQCAKCGHDYRMEVGIMNRGFFSPSAARKDLKKKYSSSWSGLKGTPTKG